MSASSAGAGGAMFQHPGRRPGLSWCGHRILLGSDLTYRPRILRHSGGSEVIIVMPSTRHFSPPDAIEPIAGSCGPDLATATACLAGEPPFHRSHYSSKFATNIRASSRNSGGARARPPSLIAESPRGCPALDETNSCVRVIDQPPLPAKYCGRLGDPPTTHWVFRAQPHVSSSSP